MSVPFGACVVGCLVALAACSPALDWRETRAEGSGVVLLFPCRPDRHERTIRLGGADTRMQMVSCHAAGAAFSLAFAEAADATRVTPLVAALRAAAAANIGAVPTVRAFAVAGATPNEQSGLLRMEGRLPDGRRVVEHAAFFVKGLRVYAATVLGESITAEAADTFFTSIKSVS